MRSRRTAVCCAVASAALFGALTLLVVTTWAPLADADADILPTLHDPTSRHHGLFVAAIAVSNALHPWTFRFAAVVGTLALLAAARRPARTASRRMALFAVVTIVVGGLLSGAVKELVGRSRPTPSAALAQASGMSYPSGHALGVTVAVAVALGAVMWVTGRRPAPWLWVTGLLAVVAVGLSRMALGLHHPSDVLGGCLLGIAWASAMAAVLLPRAAPRADA